MKYLIIALFIPLTLLLSCNSGDSDSDSEGDSGSDSVAVEELNRENLLSVERWDSIAFEYEGDKEYYIISYAGVEQEADAIAMVDSLKPNYENAGYLWIPDFTSLSGKELYAVFVDQSAYDTEIWKSYQAQKTDNKGTYIVRVNQSEERWEAYSPIDIRVNGERQKMISVYAHPDDEESYFEEGGEDWMWFTSDLLSYFEENYPGEIGTNNFFRGELLDNEKAAIESELGISRDIGFGYVLINGNKKSFLGYDMPDYMIQEACKFFGFPEPEFDY